MDTKMDEAWNKVFQSLDLLSKIESDGFVQISATTLKKEGEREARLMAKHDTISSRPTIFKKHNLSILPIKNGEYVIYRDSKKKSYFKYDTEFDNVLKEIYDPSPDYEAIESLNGKTITSESQAIDYANLVSLLKTFTNESQLHLTIRGRLRSGNFSLNLPDNNVQIEVNGVQIEVDSGYEGKNGIYLIEAKIGKRDDFHIRQLYYPWKEWSQKTVKPVIPIFFFYSNGIFYLTKFQFGENFGDLKIVELRSFSINEDPILIVNYEELIRSVPIDVSEPNVPFPQANDLDKIIDIITSFGEDLKTKDQISEYFDFHGRQGDYYANAAIYLGLLKRDTKNRGSFILTDLGEKMRSCSNRRCRNRLIFTQLLRRPSFRSAIILLKDCDFKPVDIDKDDVTQIIMKNEMRCNHTTCRRRASTVKSWMKWICANIKFNS
ncbi:hypothetical protein L1S32_06345 [Methanogenium sp. S4BF]|uniref:type II restriction enzyme n=1 Tax=Methanogenium sp. S4BF TaxID=1789226 RepID=UPI0024160C14|nr:hypothetical protein [Methanogenium sp. S4BF]WFN33478.1 hypothetical protein L1S32_06345 [Methanogenium sp. S4BF]